jgi:histidyl-tRNA synthetase
MEKIAAPRGTADALPPQSAQWAAVENRMREVAARFGYAEIRTPMFESTALFVRGVGEGTDIVDKEMYTFDDKGGRSMTLRPEITAPVMRAVIEHNLLAAGPARLMYIGPIFRYERPQAGRLREAHQFGLECIGFAGPEADAEVIAVAAALLRECGIDASLSLNSIGDDACRPAYREALIGYLNGQRERLSEDSQRRLERSPLRVLDSKAPEDRAIVEAAPIITDYLCDPCGEHLVRVQQLLSVVGIPYMLDPRIARGLDYYTRTVFEFSSTALGAQSALCGGGRYDNLVASLGGPPTPSVGFALGIERLLMVMETLAAQAPPERNGIAVIGLGEAARTRCFEIAAALRNTIGKSDYFGAPPIVMDYSDSKLETQLKRADRAGARMAVIAGDDELASGGVVLRDLERRDQVTSGPLPAATDAALWIIERYVQAIAEPAE